MSKLTIAAAATAAMTLAGSAHAFTYFSVGSTTGPAPGDPGPVLGQTTVVTFDSASASGITETDLGLVGLYTGTNAYHAAPAGDTSVYEAIGPNGSATFNFSAYESTHTINSLSVYLGSIDSFNDITIFSKTGAIIASLNGTDFPASNGDQGASITNRRVYFSFTPADDFGSIEFSSTGYAFEFDDIAVGPASFNNIQPGAVLAGGLGVPEPQSWALMLIGFGAIGAASRRKRTAITA